MNEGALGEIVQGGFALVVLLALPIVAAGTVAAAAAGWLAGRVGLTDPTVALVARALAVVLAIGVTLDGLRGNTVELARDLWARVGSAGRGEGPSSP